MNEKDLFTTCVPLDSFHEICAHPLQTDSILPLVFQRACRDPIECNQTIS